jgi:hypothetical protein
MTDIHWLNALNGNFNASADWSGGVDPGPSDDAILDAAGSSFTVSVTEAATVNGIDLAANATLLVDAKFAVTNGTDRGVNAGSVQVDGKQRFVIVTRRRSASSMRRRPLMAAVVFRSWGIAPSKRATAGLPF